MFSMYFRRVIVFENWREVAVAVLLKGTVLSELGVSLHRVISNH